MPWWIYLIIGFIAIDFLLVLFIFVKKSRRDKLDTASQEYIKSHWFRILDSFDHDPKHAILDADKLLDFALSKHGFIGNVGEKMKKARWRFSDNNGVWQAHKLRNKIAHEMGDIDKSRAKSSLKRFKRALIDLGANI